jgi:hypothetical protein
MICQEMQSRFDVIWLLINFHVPVVKVWLPSESSFIVGELSRLRVSAVSVSWRLFNGLGSTLGNCVGAG